MERKKCLLKIHHISPRFDRQFSDSSFFGRGARKRVNFMTIFGVLGHFTKGGRTHRNFRLQQNPPTAKFISACAVVLYCAIMHA